MRHNGVTSTGRTTGQGEAAGACMPKGGRAATGLERIPRLYEEWGRFWAASRPTACVRRRCCKDTDWLMAHPAAAGAPEEIAKPVRPGAASAVRTGVGTSGSGPARSRADPEG